MQHSVRATGLFSGGFAGIGARPVRGRIEKYFFSVIH
jgi:hypothetical protein